MKPATLNSFGRALVHVWESHPEVLAAEAGVRASGFDTRAAWTAFLPYGQLDMARSRHSDDYVARLVLPLFRGGANFAGLDAAEAAQTGAVADLQRARLSLGLKLTDAWMALVAAREQDQLWDSYVASLKRLQGVIKRRAGAGAAPGSDVLSAQTRLHQADAQAALNRSVLASAQAQLTTLLGVAVVAAAWPADSMALTEPELANASARAYDGHPEVAFAQARVARAEAESRLARSQTLPEVLLQHEKPFGDRQSNQGNDTLTQVVLRYQTDNGLKGYQSWRAGEQRVALAKSGVEAAKRDVAASIRVAEAERLAALAQLNYQRDAVRSASEVVDSFLRQFEVGRKTWLEVLNAQREAHETRLQQVQSRKTFWLAEARLALHALYWEKLLREMDAVSAGPVSLPTLPGGAP